MTTEATSQHDNRGALIGAGLVDRMVAFSGRRFHSTRIPAYLWLRWKNEHAGKRRNVPELELSLAA